jgi:hypothetical protein
MNSIPLKYSIKPVSVLNRMSPKAGLAGRFADVPVGKRTPDEPDGITRFFT